jgi:hypothetical protein
VQKNEDLLILVAESPSIASKLRQIEDKAWPVSFSHVIDSAQPFLVAALARKIHKPIWVLCPSVRAQELFYESLVNWLPSADFLPEAEFAAASLYSEKSTKTTVVTLSSPRAPALINPRPNPVRCERRPSGWT